MVRASTARLLARRIPHARLEVVPGASHFFLLREDTREIARTITGFLDEDDLLRQAGVAFAAT
jgi:pimeloyl-ACP methyl ester carboxylesterase